MAGPSRRPRTSDPTRRDNWPTAGPYLRLLRHIDGVREREGRKSPRSIAANWPRGGAMSHQTIRDRLAGNTPLQNEGEVEGIVKALGGSPEDVTTAIRLFRTVHSDIARVNTPRSRPAAAPADRSEIDALLAEMLPKAQQASGNRGMLAEVVVAELQPDERLIQLVPCHSQRAMRGSAVLILTDRATILVELVGTGVAGSSQRAPLPEVTKVPLERHCWWFRRTADLTTRWHAGNEWHCRGMLRWQAEQCADLLRAATRHAHDPSRQ